MACSHGKDDGGNWANSSAREAIRKHAKQCPNTQPFSHEIGFLGLFYAVCCATCGECLYGD
jgi:hypothetical protein